ncbi:hypothetical protein CEUSTIGMA_g8923.t1 [Chlamydomonas eustigma]|uniref:DNA primase large subunit C-terminal domain-containing protein n=1 Tax=Chlamydomonas eustigma TaxID=1157962 RepID=A0A250XEI4_9CHLO|nr:hypothetical protein CEUSTIGMA_g8923.t1 [Chlamydomonas eustigma]|eukprot:GAX81494.1 hypothetical protein CEUSTIGMA_g8923.t1 [Chlamydomonas eustigma]
MNFLGNKPAAPEESRAGRKHADEHRIVRLYKDHPTCDISIDEFERLALQRLRVLKKVEDLKLRGKQDEALMTEVMTSIRDNNLEGSAIEDPMRADQLSHFILRLSYCGKPELRKWFTTQECELFRLRFIDKLKTEDDRALFLQREGLAYTAVQTSEREMVQQKMKEVLRSSGNDGDIKIEQIFKVPFISVPDLVSQRKVWLHGGFAYVGQKDLVSLVAQDFRINLSKGLASISRRWREIFPDSDQRLRPLVEGLSQRYLGPDLGAAGNQARRSDLTVANLTSVSARHFPLCMHNLMQTVRRDHHLRHQGRQQLSLFLKAVGLPLEEALIFWRSEFGPKVPGDKFDKEYAYNIRHNYGKEGKMTEYTAHSCVSITRMTGGADEHHGCPYRRMDEASLRANLATLRCEPARINEAMQKKAGGHFQLACACTFQGLHAGADLELGINHPAQYYLESRRVYDERESAGGSSKPAAIPEAGAGPS